jgi:hypothetical protein
MGANLWWAGKRSGERGLSTMSDERFSLREKVDCVGSPEYRFTHLGCAFSAVVVEMRSSFKICELNASAGVALSHFRGTS